MRKAAIAAAVAASIAAGVAGCGNGPGGPTGQQIADNWCKTTWTHEMKWAQNFAGDLGTPPAQVRQLAQASMQAAEASKGITCS